MTLSEARPVGQIDQDRSESYRLPANARVRVRNRRELGEIDILRFIIRELAEVPKGGWRAIEKKYRGEEEKWQRHAEKMEKERQEYLRQEDLRWEEQRVLNERLQAIAILPGLGSSGWVTPAIVRDLPETGTWDFEREKSW